MAGDRGDADANTEAEAELEVGGGSLATLVSGGAMTGDRDCGDCADCGADAVEERVGPGPESGTKEGDVAAAAEVVPVSSETSLSETALPEKNSPEVREGSIEGAGGKMSDWNESDFFPSRQSRSGQTVVGCGEKEKAYFARDDERDWFDGVRRELVRSCDLAI